MSDKQTSSAGESFAGSVMKYSVATYLGFGITGAAIIVQGILGPEKIALPAQFMNTTATFMYLCILGLDQSLLRFYHEPPAGATGRGLFGACAALSSAFTLVLGAVCSLFFATRIGTFTFGQNYAAVGRGIVPLLFLNAGLYMLVRYLNVLLRLENNLRAYTLETLWMQACFNLVYLLPGFFTANVYWFALASVMGFGVTAIAFWCKAGLQKPERLAPAVYRTVVPYGLALAPSQVLVYLNSTVSSSFLLNYTTATAQGIYAFCLRVANLVTAIQAGFSTFWGPYVFAHYREEQERISHVHDILNLLIFGFFSVLVMFEDVIFLVSPPTGRACRCSRCSCSAWCSASCARAPSTATPSPAVPGTIPSASASARRSIWGCACCWCPGTGWWGRRCRWRRRAAQCFCTAPSPGSIFTAPSPATPEPPRVFFWPLPSPRRGCCCGRISC